MKKNRIWIGLGLLFLILVEPLKGCSARPKIAQPTIRYLHPETLRFRRPLHPSAEPTAGPGGVDYRTVIKTNNRYDCQTRGEFYRSIKLAEVRECLDSIEIPVDVEYELERTERPVWTLIVEDETPQCIQDFLSEIPIPREIIYQSSDEGELRCYATRFDVDADEFLGSKIPLADMKLKLPLPLLGSPEDDESLYGFLIAWSLTALSKRGSGLELPAQYFPQNLCVRCVGETSILKKDSGPRFEWPTRPKPKPSPSPSPSVKPVA